MQQNFYQYQQRCLSLLLGWSFLSMITGLVMQFNPKPFWKQFGLQALVWGAIDALLAAFGLRSANQKENRYTIGKLSFHDETKEAQSFYRILLINTGLDVLYVAGGVWLMQRFKARADRRGMGLGILVQGLWLFLFDGLVSQEVWRRWKV